MNASRLRRPVIQARARKAMMRRMHRAMTRGKLDLSPMIQPMTRRARVYFRLEMGLEEDGFITSAMVDLPHDRPTEFIRNMQKNGFWIGRIDDGHMTFILPDQIMQVKMDPEIS